LTLVSNKETQKIFLTTNSKLKNLTNSKFDIIVSPEFYWARKFEIPVKTEAQARHVLPTLFEDIVEDITTLTYQVIKLEENQFLCFAYNNKKIYEAVKKIHIPTSQINAFYFAQNECKEFNSFEVDGLKYMYTNEGILVKVPNTLLPDAISLEKVINKIKPTSHKLQIKLYSDVISSKFYYVLFAISAVLILINFIKYFDYSNQISKLEEKELKVKQLNKLPSSMLQTSSILKKYDSKILKETKKREAIYYIFSNSKFDLKSLDIENDEIVLEYLSSNKNDVERFLRKKFKSISSVQKAFNLKVRIKL